MLFERVLKIFRYIFLFRTACLMGTTLTGGHLLKYDMKIDNNNSRKKNNDGNKNLFKKKERRIFKNEKTLNWWRSN